MIVAVVSGRKTKVFVPVLLPLLLVLSLILLAYVMLDI